MYKAIIFDLDHTLLDYNQSEWSSMQQTIRQHRLDQTEGFHWDIYWHQYRQFNQTYWENRDEWKITIEQVLDFSFRDTLTKLEHEHHLSKDLAETYWALFCQSCHLEEGTVQLLERLHPIYKLGVISNGIGEAQRGRLNAAGIHDYFESFLFSDEVGYGKPDKKIFDQALRELEVSAEEVLYIGDSLPDDCEGAHRAGIDFCWYNPHHKRAGEHQPIRIMVHSLADLALYI